MRLQPIDRILRPLARFLHIEATSGVVLVACTVIALVSANSSFAESYLAFWQTKITLGFGAFEFHHSLLHVINDGLMAIFFFVAKSIYWKRRMSFTTAAGGTAAVELKLYERFNK